MYIYSYPHKYNFLSGYNVTYMYTPLSLSYYLSLSSFFFLTYVSQAALEFVILLTLPLKCLQVYTTKLPKKTGVSLVFSQIFDYFLPKEKLPKHRR